jgi:hypothetical protein
MNSCWLDLDALLDEHQHGNAALPGPGELLLGRRQAAVEDRLAVAAPEQQQVRVGLVDTAKTSLSGGNRLGGVVLEPLALVADRLDQRWQVVAFLLQATADRGQEHHESARHGMRWRLPAAGASSSAITTPV